MYAGRRIISSASIDEDYFPHKNIHLRTSSAQRHITKGSKLLSRTAVIEDSLSQQRYPVLGLKRGSETSNKVAWVGANHKKVNRPQTAKTGASST